jgi:hypothetical protein
MTGEEEPGGQRVGDAVERLLHHHHKCALYRDPHPQVVKRVDQRHPDQEPVKRVRLDHADLAAAHQRADGGHLQGHGDDGVGVIPKHKGVTGDDGAGKQGAAGAEELQDQHGEDASEEKVRIKEEGELQIVAGQAGRDQGQIK